MLRLASKVLENRLKRLFLHVISENQSAFMSERLITNSVVVAFETMHHINQKKMGKIREMAVKLDMSKAYNRVEWDCLEKLMGKIGFHEKLVNIMKSFGNLWTGLRTTIELEKISLFFSSNTPQDIEDDIKTRFGADIICQHETYLGFPSLVGKSKCNTFWQLMERLDNKLSGWKEKMLLSAGKEILIKVVAQVIPTTTNKTCGDKHFSSWNTLISSPMTYGDETSFVT